MFSGSRFNVPCVSRGVKFLPVLKKFPGVSFRGSGVSITG